MVNKYSLTFTASAETLFGLLAKLLPVDDLHIHAEEVGDHSPAVVKAMAGFNHALVERRAKEAIPRRAKRRSKGLNLDEGINSILLKAMSDGKGWKSTDLAPLLTASGYSPNSVGSRLQNLREHNVVKQMGDGAWRLSVPVNNERAST